jgi:hypothetical protein
VTGNNSNSKSKIYLLVGQLLIRLTIPGRLLYSCISSNLPMLQFHHLKTTAVRNAFEDIFVIAIILEKRKEVFWDMLSK